MDANFRTMKNLFAEINPWVLNRAGLAEADCPPAGEHSTLEAWCLLLGQRKSCDGVGGKRAVELVESREVRGSWQLCRGRVVAHKYSARAPRKTPSRQSATENPRQPAVVMQSCLFKLGGHWIAAMQPSCPKRPRANHDIYFGRCFRAWALAQELAAHMAGDWTTRSGGTPFRGGDKEGEKVRLSSCVIARRRVTPFRQPQGRPGRESPAAPEGRSPVRLESYQHQKKGSTEAWAVGYPRGQVSALKASHESVPQNAHARGNLCINLGPENLMLQTRGNKRVLAGKWYHRGHWLQLTKHR